MSTDSERLPKLLGNRLLVDNKQAGTNEKTKPVEEMYLSDISSDSEEMDEYLEKRHDYLIKQIDEIKNR